MGVITVLLLALPTASFSLPSSPKKDPLEIMLFEQTSKVVTPGRREMNIKESPSAISVITRSEIMYSPARTIPELLQYVVGMDGYTKTLTDMDIVARGQVFDEAGQMLVLIDGQPVNVAPYTGMQWPTLPIMMDDIERIEVMRGPGSSIYGADALLGVVNIITVPVAERKSNIKATLGEKGTQAVDIHIAHQIDDKLSLAGTVGYKQTQAQGAAETEQATGVAPNWQIKDWANVEILGYRLDYMDAGLKVFSEAGYSTDEEGYAPSPGDAAVDFSNKQTSYMSNKIMLPIQDDEISMNAGFRNLWQRNEKYVSGDYVFKYLVSKGLGIDANLQYILRRIPFNTVTFGANYSQVIASREIANPEPYVYDASDRLLGAFIQDQVSLLDNNLLLTLGGRYDKWTSLDGIFSPMAAINYLTMEKTLTFRLMAATSFRRPDFDSRFYYVDLSGLGPDSWFKGTDLTLPTADGRVIEGKTPKPETAVSYEGSVRWTPDPSLSANLNYFFQTVKDMSASNTIYANLPGMATYNPSLPDGYNLSYRNDTGRIETHGLEFEVSKTFGNTFKLFTNWTGQVGQLIAEDGTRSEWRAMPKNKVNAGVVYSGVVNMDLRVRFVGETYFNEVGTSDIAKVAAYKTVDVAFFKEFGNLLLKLSVVDLLNDVHYEYPLYMQMVRKAMLTAQYTF